MYCYEDEVINRQKKGGEERRAKNIFEIRAEKQEFYLPGEKIFGSIYSVAHYVHSLAK